MKTHPNTTGRCPPPGCQGRDRQQATPLIGRSLLARNRSSTPGRTGKSDALPHSHPRALRTRLPPRYALGLEAIRTPERPLPSGMSRDSISVQPGGLRSQVRRFESFWGHFSSFWPAVSSALAPPVAILRPGIALSAGYRGGPTPRLTRCEAPRRHEDQPGCAIGAPNSSPIVQPTHGYLPPPAPTLPASSWSSTDSASSSTSEPSAHSMPRRPSSPGDRQAL